MPAEDPDLCPNSSPALRASASPHEVNDALLPFLRPLSPSALVFLNTQMPPTAETNAGQGHSSSFGTKLETEVRQPVGNISMHSDPDNLLNNQQPQLISLDSGNSAHDISSLFTPAQSQASSTTSTDDILHSERVTSENSIDSGQISSPRPHHFSAHAPVESATTLILPAETSLNLAVEASSEPLQTETTDLLEHIQAQSVSSASIPFDEAVPSPASADATSLDGERLLSSDVIETRTADEDMERFVSPSPEISETFSDVVKTNPVPSEDGGHPNVASAQVPTESAFKDPSSTPEDTDNVLEPFFEDSHVAPEENSEEAYFRELSSSSTPLSASLNAHHFYSPDIESDVFPPHRVPQADTTLSDSAVATSYVAPSAAPSVVESIYSAKLIVDEPSEDESLMQHANETSPVLTPDGEKHHFVGLSEYVYHNLDGIHDDPSMADIRSPLEEPYCNPETIQEDQMRSSSPFSSSARLFTSSPLPSSQSSAMDDLEWGMKPASIPTMDEEFSPYLSSKSQTRDNFHSKPAEDDERSDLDLSTHHFSSSPLPPSSPRIAPSSPMLPPSSDLPDHTTEAMESEHPVDDELIDCIVPHFSLSLPSLPVSTTSHLPGIEMNGAHFDIDTINVRMLEDSAGPVGSLNFAQSSELSGPIQDPQNTTDILSPEGASKRKLSQVEEGHLLIEKKPKMDMPPAPKRSTVASQRKQFQKLITPFRPLTIVKAPNLEGPSTVLHRLPSLPPIQSEVAKRRERASETKLKHRTERAGGQFKSPLAVVPSNSSASVRMTPAIQVLERKIQNLRRAVKVKSQGEEATLQGLIKQWLEAGREVAYELWQLNKDVHGNPEGLKLKKEDPWAQWSSDGDSKSKEEGWGWDEAFVKIENHEEEAMYEKDTEVEENEPEVEQTLGLMLRQLGIAPETLGWDEREEVFVD